MSSAEATSKVAMVGKGSFHFCARPPHSSERRTVLLPNKCRLKKAKRERAHRIDGSGSSCIAKSDDVLVRSLGRAGQVGYIGTTGFRHAG